MYNIGSVAAVFFTGPVNDYFGRRWGMWAGALFIIVGTCVQAPSSNLSQFLGGRFLLGFGVSFCCVSAPTYVSEISHPKWRGTLTGRTLDHARLNLTTLPYFAPFLSKITTAASLT